MKVAPVQAGEHAISKTQLELPAYAIQEAEFNDICHLVAEVCHSPVQLISIIDSGRQWFRARHPLITAELTADFAFCTQALHTPRDIFIINDLHKDYRFGKHLLVTAVPYVAFYAGIPLVTSEGTVLGTLCMWDNKIRELTQNQVTALQSLSRQVAANMELKNQAALLSQKTEELRSAYADLEAFSTIAAHDLKSPLNAIISLTDLLKGIYTDRLDEEGNEYLDFLQASAQNLADLVTSVLNYSRSSQLLTTEKENINFSELISEITGLLKIPEHATISYIQSNNIINSNRVALKQVLMNLLDNALKYNDKGAIDIDISFCENPTSYSVAVKDNGVGIHEEEREKIFELFKRLKNKVNDGKGMGIGLAIVKRLVEKLGGNVTVASELGKGTSFVITLPK